MLYCGRKLTKTKGRQTLSYRFHAANAQAMLKTKGTGGMGNFALTWVIELAVNKRQKNCRRPCSCSHHSVSALIVFTNSFNRAKIRFPMSRVGTNELVQAQTSWLAHPLWEATAWAYCFSQHRPDMQEKKNR